MNFSCFVFLFLILNAYVYSGSENTCSNPNFKPYENVYVINLKSRPDRLAFMKDVLNEIDQPFTLIEAFNGKELSELCKTKPTVIDSKIVYTCQDFIRDQNYRRCKVGEVGCWLSHIKVFQQIVENYEKTGRDNPSIILEDDVDLELNFKELVNNSLCKLNPDWETFYIGYFHPERWVELGNNIGWAPHFSGTFAYVIRDAKVAKKMISFSNTSYCLIADRFNLIAQQRGQLKAYLSFPEHYASFYSDLGCDIDHIDVKEGPSWVKQLKQSAYEKVKKRKDEV